MDLFEDNKPENSETHDVVYINSSLLIAMVLNDLPAQISKAVDTFLPKLFKCLEQRIPNYNSYFLSVLKLITSVTVHEKGKE